VEDSDPLEGERGKCGLMSCTPERGGSHRRLLPRRSGDGLGGPFDEGLAQKSAKTAESLSRNQSRTCGKIGFERVGDAVGEPSPIVDEVASSLDDSAQGAHLR